MYRIYSVLFTRTLFKEYIVILKDIKFILTPTCLEAFLPMWTCRSGLGQWWAEASSWQFHPVT